MPSPEELARQNIDAHFPILGSTRAPRVEFGDLPNALSNGRKFTELYNVQHLQSAQLDRVSRICISTIQRLYSIQRSFFFWIETWMPQDPIMRGDRQRLVRVQRTLWTAPYEIHVANLSA